MANLGDASCATISCLALLLVTSAAMGLECPANSHISGSYCVPNTGTSPGPAIPKIGSCPTDYHPAGDLCIGSQNAKRAVIRIGSCPTDHHASGDYCLANR